MTLATLVGKRTEGVVSPPEGPSIADPGLGLESRAAELSENAENLKAGTTRIAVAGGVSAGKTTLLCAGAAHGSGREDRCHYRNRARRRPEYGGDLLLPPHLMQVGSARAQSSSAFSREGIILITPV